MAARFGIVLFLSVLIVGTALAATPAGARVVPAGYYPAPVGAGDGTAFARAAAGGGRRGGIRRGRWNVQQGDAARKREVPGGPDPQHHN
ncbi:hypothetical protein SEVIR_5G325601v4 [Setaria viridis]|uniref:Uncharacterized protein n=2 Tax=Setaria TaxID=4554 RepID=K3XRK2_SETIT|nr:hypothetical protein SETIT_5G322000v2 [Setaria italica]TKW16838.1 hypothetical protein SEVIR_5G325601v2 [Setaria viridis]